MSRIVNADRLAADDAMKAEVDHQPRDCSARDAEAFARHLTPNFALAIHLEVRGEDALDLRLQIRLPLCPDRQRREGS